MFSFLCIIIKTEHSDLFNFKLEEEETEEDAGKQISFVFKGSQNKNFPGKYYLENLERSQNFHLIGEREENFCGSHVENKLRNCIVHRNFFFFLVTEKKKWLWPISVIITLGFRPKRAYQKVGDGQCKKYYNR